MERIKIQDLAIEEMNKVNGGVRAITLEDGTVVDCLGKTLPDGRWVPHGTIIFGG